MSTRHVIRLTEPAAAFHDAFLLGNGTLGATVYGRPGVERIDLNLDTFWSGGPLTADTDTGTDTGPASVLTSLRQAVRERDDPRADTLARELQGDGYTESYQPLGQLGWPYAAQISESAAALEEYARELDLAEAAARVAYDGVQTECFVSWPDKVMVMSATGGDLIAPVFRSPHPGTEIRTWTERGVLWLVATGRAPARVLPNYVDADLPVIYADGDGDGEVPAGMAFAVAAAVQRTGPGQVRLIVAAADGFRGFDRRPSADRTAIATTAESTVRKVLGAGTEVLRERHRADHRTYFDRADLDLTASGPGASGAESLFHLGRYLLIACSRPGTQAANLQGIWNIDVRPGWSSNYTTNINTQMNYWAAESTGLPEFHEPLFELNRDLASSGSVTAERHYGARGSVVHHNTDLWRFTAPVKGDPQWANWPAALWWLAAHAWDHLDYGGDSEFAQATALPVLRAAALSALDLLVPLADGSLVTSPSTSPEHRFVSQGSQTAAVSEGTAMDQELVREVLTRYADLADPAEPARKEALAALEQLRPVAVGRNGELLEWLDERTPSELGHRHLSHLYGLFPGARITEVGTPDDFEAARRALAVRLEHGSGYTGWSQAWVLCLAARLRDPALAERAINVLLGPLSSRSLLDLHPHDDWPGGAIFQIDGNLGAVAGLAELLVQSHEGAISLLKTLPTSWPAGTARGLRCRGGHVVDLTWTAGSLESARITAGRDGRLVVELPGEVPVTVTDEAGPVAAVSAAEGAIEGRTRHAWQAEAGRTYTVAVAGQQPS